MLSSFLGSSFVNAILLVLGLVFLAKRY